MDQPAKGAAQPLPISLTINGAVSYTGLSRASLYRLIAAGKLTAKKHGHRTYLLTQELSDFMTNLPPKQ